MIITIDDTTTRAVNSRMVRLRDEGGAVALGRVLTLVIDAGTGDVEEAIEAANRASREHPCRILALQTMSRRKLPRLDAEIRVGGDAGASEVILLKVSGPQAEQRDTLVTSLLLPDAPIVLWWPNDAPDNPGATALGQMATRRITDVVNMSNPRKHLSVLAENYTAGDTDLAWTRVNHWRAVVAAALDLEPYGKVTKVTIDGQQGLPGIDLFGGWLAYELKVDVRIQRHSGNGGITKIVLDRANGPIVFNRPDGRNLTFEMPGQPIRRLGVPLQGTGEALGEELRRLDPDDVYGMALTKGLARLAKK